MPTLSPIKIQGIPTPRPWSWSADYTRHVRAQARTLDKGHSRGRRKNMEYRAHQYANWLAYRDGIDVPTCGEHVGVTVEIGAVQLHNAKGELRNDTAPRAVVWRCGEMHGSGIYGSREFRPSYDPEDVLLRIEIPNWDSDPEAAPVQRAVL